MSVQTLRQQIEASYPGTVQDMTCAQPNAVSSWSAVQGTSQSTINAIQTIIDNFNWNTPAPDYTGFLHDVVTNAAATSFPYAVVAAQMLANPVLTYSDRKAWAVLCSTWLQALYPANYTTIANFLIATANTHNMPIT